MEEKMFLVRIGSNAEKKYIEQTGRFFSGVNARGNLFEASPGMLVAMFAALGQESSGPGYSIDPVTYVYALDPYHEWSIRSWQKVSQEVARTRLADTLRIPADQVDSSWIRPIPDPDPIRDSGRVQIFGIKRAYRSLADKTLGPLRDLAGLRALGVDLFRREIASVTEAVVRYQVEALQQFLYGRYADIISRVPQPQLVFSPYFLIGSQDWVHLTLNIWQEFDQCRTGDAATIVVQAPPGAVATWRSELLDGIKSSAAINVGIWLDRFDEKTANASDLDAYASFVIELSRMGKRPLAFHGGGFSMLLLAFGLGGLVTGPGYGESRDVEPVVGGMPATKYYVPSLYSRETVVDAFQLLFAARLGSDVEDFMQRVCHCGICRDGITRGREDLIGFYGELGSPRTLADGSVRKFPTPAALERSFFHFLLNRISEFRRFRSATPAEALDYLRRSVELWKNVPGAGSYLQRWQDVLERYS